MKNERCIFCKIVAGEVPSYKVHENEDHLAILDIAQFTEGHTIVIPKDHYEFIWDVPNVGKYFSFVREIGDHFRDNGFKYVDTLTFGRMIHHAHVHLVPHNGDSKDWETALNTIGKYQSDPDRHPSKEDGERIARKLRIS